MRSSVSALTKLPRLARAIHGARSDVVQTWMYNSNLIGGLASRLCGIPTVWGVHHSTVDSLPVARRAVALFTGTLAPWVPDYIINCSVASANNHAALGYERAAGAVVPNGYDPDTYFPDEAARLSTRRSLGIGEQVFVLGTISRWNAIKAVPDLLAAVDILVRRGIRLRCLLIGTGLDLTNYDFVRALQQVKCGTSLLPLGRRPDIPELARAMDLHVLPSLTEACPNVIAETMLSGTPNVATDVGDSGRLVGDTGWLVSPGQPERLADAIELAYREWTDRRENWDERRAASRSRIIEKFSLEVMTSSYHDVWRRVASLGGSA